MKTILFPTDSSVEENISTQALNNLLHYVEKEKLNEKNIFADCDVCFGLAVDNINNLAKEKNVSFIIMGTKGSSGINEIILGSITSKVIENAPCPVLIIPDKTKYKVITKIIFATDFHVNDIESINFIEKLFSPSITKKMSYHTNIPMLVFHV